MNELLKQIKEEALINEVPIIQDPSLEVIKELIEQHHVEKIIEIGTAVAYSSLAFSENEQIKRIDTYERNPEMFEKATKNVKSLNKHITS